MDTSPYRSSQATVREMLQTVFGQLWTKALLDPLVHLLLRRLAYLLCRCFQTWMKFRQYR
jgi:hypothetical protein